MSRFAKGVLSRCQTWHMTLQYVAYRSVKDALSHRERTPFTFYRVMCYNCKVYKTLTYSDLSKKSEKLLKNRIFFSFVALGRKFLSYQGLKLIN